MAAWHYKGRYESALSQQPYRFFSSSSLCVYPLLTRLTHTQNTLVLPPPSHAALPKPWYGEGRANPVCLYPAARRPIFCCSSQPPARDVRCVGLPLHPSGCQSWLWHLFAIPIPWEDQNNRTSGCPLLPSWFMSCRSSTASFIFLFNHLRAKAADTCSCPV